MKTIALRFSNSFAPESGTIQAHQDLIEQYGHVWYGKLGTRISNKVADDIMKNSSPQILLIHSGTSKRYWAKIDQIQYEVPPLAEIPEYYRSRVKEFKTWFRVKQFQVAPGNILSHCIVPSSGHSLSQASKHSMSPYFIIETYIPNIDESASL